MLQFTFGDQRYLLILLAIPVVIWLARRSLSDLSPGRKRLSVFVRCLIVALLALALAETKRWDLDKNFHLAIVADRSLSIPDELRQRELLYAEDVAKALDPISDKGELIVFGEEAQIETHLDLETEKIQPSSVLDRDFTNIDKAIRLAVASFPRGPKRRIVVISDGNQNVGDAEAAAAFAWSRGCQVDVLPISYEKTGDVLVEKLLLPPRIDAGETFPVRVVIQSDRSRKARVVLRMAGQTIAQSDTVLVAGRNVITFEHETDKRGFQRLEAQVIPEGDDPITNNNRAYTFKVLSGKSSVLYVHEGVVSDGFLTEALGDAEIAVEERPAFDFPLFAGELQAYDSIILDNVSAENFTDEQLQAIEFAVKQFGVGLIMIGGERSFAAGLWTDTPVERALPVDCDIKQKRVIPNGAMAMIMHTCEFPNGNTWMKKIAEAAIKVLTSQDWVGLLYYDPFTGDQWGIRMQKAADKGGMIGVIRKIDPGDMPEFDPTLEMAIDSLIPINAAMKHILILSDGDPPPPARGLINACIDNKISISTVCMNPHSGAAGTEVQMMRSLAIETKGKFYLPTNANELPQIFTKEAKRVQSKLIVEGNLQVLLERQTQPLRGLDSFPNLYGYVMVQPKDAAEIALKIGKDKDVLLAHWRYGAGKTAAFTSDATATWAQGWLPEPVYGQFWPQLVRWVSKEVTESPLQVNTSIKGRTAKIVVDAVEGGEFRDDLAMEARVLSPDGKESTIKFEQTAPGRYVAELASDEVGAHVLTVIGVSGDGDVLQTNSGVVFSYSDEYRNLRGASPPIGGGEASQGWRNLMRIKDAGNGSVLEWDDLEPVLDRDGLKAGRSYIDLWPLWPWLLGIALALFPFDVALRRVAIDWEILRARIDATLASMRGSERAAAAAATLNQLREKRTEAQIATSKKFESQTPFSGRIAPIPGFHGRAARPGEISEKERKRADRKKAPSPPSRGEGAFTSRLLEAKRRARKNMEQDS